MLNNSNESIIKQEPKKFNKPNLMIKIAQDRSLTARDKKIYNIFIRELLSLNLQEFKNNEITLSISKLSKLLGVKYRNDLYESIENLMKTMITFEDENIQKRGTFLKTRAVMISSYTRPIETLLDYDENDEYSNENLIIRFDTKLTKTILRYADKYAKLDLTDINSLKVSHAITLYEIFVRSLGIRSYQKVHYTEQELRKYLHLNDKYENTSEFNRTVIKKSIDEINKKTKLSISYKREKNSNKENVYKFEVNQDYRFSFNKFKKTIIEHYRDFSFRYKNNEYIITRDLDDKNAKYLIAYAQTYKTLQKEKAEEIYQFMYEILNRDSVEFVYKFISMKNLNDTDFNRQEIDRNDLDEANLFFQRYEETK